MARKLTDMQFDEVSLVDRAANQFADIVIAKSDDAADYDEMESLLAEFSDNFAKAADDDDEDDDDEDEGDDEDEEELTSKAFPQPDKPRQPGIPVAPAAPVAAVPAAAPPVPGMAPGVPMAAPPAAPPPGTPPPQLPQVQLPPEVVQYIKALEARISALTNQQGNYSPMAQTPGQSEAPSHFNEGEGVRKMSQEDESVFAALAKALADTDTDPQVATEISKAMDLVSKAQARADEAERIAKEERDYRLEQEYISKAANLALPVSPQELGPVLKRMDDLMAPKDAEIITKALLAGSEAIQSVFEEAGTTYGAAYETLSKVDQVANELVVKSGHQMTREQATAAIYEMDPSIYEEYLSDKNGGN